MTKRFAILAGLLLIATGAYAQKAAISVFVANPGGGWSSNEGTTANGDVGVGAEYWFTPGVSAAVNISRHRDYEPIITFDPNGFPVFTTHYGYEYPIDGFVRYRFPGTERWKPYVGGGVLAVHAMNSFGGRGWKFQPEFNGGVTFMINRRLGLDFDGRVLPNIPAYTGIDQSRFSLGLSWHF